MAQHQLMDVSGRSSLVQVFALAGVMAMGCGGNSAPGASAEDGSDESGSSQQYVGDEVSGVEPAATNPAAPSPTRVGAPPSDPSLDGVRLDPQPTEVQLTSDAVRVGAGGGVLSSPLFIARSPLGTTLEVIEASERICVRGGLEAVPDGDYANYWGGEVGLVLGTSPPTDVAPPTDGLATLGFTFRLSGALPPQLRLRVGAAGEVPLTSQYCQNVATDTGASVEIPLQSLTFECWGLNGAPYPGTANATLVSWQIPANPEAGSQFDFCIEDIRALR
jgi:hypothetical protein